MVNYSVKALEENLQKRINVLDEIQAICDAQTNIEISSSVDIEEFDRYMDEKDVLIEILEKLDEEFDILYKDIKDSQADVQNVSRTDYLKDIVRIIKEKSTRIMEQEKFNREKVAVFFWNQKKELGAGRRASKGAYDYYKSMNHSAVVAPQFMDRKK